MKKKLYILLSQIIMSKAFSLPLYPLSTDTAKKIVNIEFDNMSLDNKIKNTIYVLPKRAASLQLKSLILENDFLANCRKLSDMQKNYRENPYSKDGFNFYEYIKYANMLGVNADINIQTHYSKTIKRLADNNPEFKFIKVIPNEVKFVLGVDNSKYNQIHTSQGILDLKYNNISLGVTDEYIIHPTNAIQNEYNFTFNISNTYACPVFNMGLIDETDPSLKPLNMIPTAAFFYKYQAISEKRLIFKYNLFEIYKFLQKEMSDNFDPMKLSKMLSLKDEFLKIIIDSGLINDIDGPPPESIIKDILIEFINTVLEIERTQRKLKVPMWIKDPELGFSTDHFYKERSQLFEKMYNKTKIVTINKDKTIQLSDLIVVLFL